MLWFLCMAFNITLQLCCCRTFFFFNFFAQIIAVAFHIVISAFAVSEGVWTVCLSNRTEHHRINKQFCRLLTASLNCLEMSISFQFHPIQFKLHTFQPRTTINFFHHSKNGICSYSNANIVSWCISLIAVGSIHCINTNTKSIKIHNPKFKRYYSIESISLHSYWILCTHTHTQTHVQAHMSRTCIKPYSISSRCRSRQLPTLCNRWR